MLILFALIIRGVSIVFRGEVDSPRWKAFGTAVWSWAAFCPRLLFGVAFANIFRGLPIDAAGIYQGNLFSLLNPYGLAWRGACSCCLFLVHGSLWLAVKTEGDLQARAGAMAGRLWPVLLVVAAMFLLGTRTQTPLFDNYLARPVLLLLPTLAVAALVATYVLIRKAAWWKAWFASCLTIVSITLFGVVGLYPNLFPSRLDPVCQPHRVQLVLQPHDLEDHAGSGPDLRAPGDCLPDLGAHPLQRQGQGTGRDLRGGLLNQAREVEPFIGKVSQQWASHRIFSVGADLRVRPQPGRTLWCAPTISWWLFEGGLVLIFSGKPRVP